MNIGNGEVIDASRKVCNPSSTWWHFLGAINWLGWFGVELRLRMGWGHLPLRVGITAELGVKVGLQHKHRSFDNIERLR